MYINPKSIKDLEDMCLVKANYSSYQHHNNGFEDFMFMRSNRNHMHEEKRYDISNVKSEKILKQCLGIEFLDMDLSLFSLKTNKKNFNHFFDRVDEEFMPFMMNRHRRHNGGQEEMAEDDFECNVMRLGQSLHLIFHAIRETCMNKDMFEYTPLIEEWKSFAKKHNVNLDHVFAPILSATEKDKEAIQYWASIKEEFTGLKEVTVDFINKSHSLMRDFYYNNPHDPRVAVDRFSYHQHPFDHIDRMQNAENEFRQQIVSKGVLEEMACIKGRIDEFKNKLSATMKGMKSDEAFDVAEIERNNNLLLDTLACAYNIMKDKINIQMSGTTLTSEAMRFSDEMLNAPFSEKAMNEYLEKYKKHTMLIVNHVACEGVNYKKLVIFIDSSCAVLVDGQEKVEYFVNIKSMKNIVKTSMVSYLKHLLRKNPTIAKMMIGRFEKSITSLNTNIKDRRCNSSLHYDKLLECLDTYFKHENILKSEKFDFIDDIEKSTSFEKLDDKMHKMIREHNIKKYADSIVSNKYKHLYNEQSYKLFKELYDLKIDIKIIQEMIGKKLAAVESETMFNNNIKSLINSFNDFNMETIKIKAASHKTKIISENDDVLILEIENFEQSEKLGSASWCISRSKTYFDQYTEKGAKQYFVYDFKHPAKSVKSLVGITLTKTLTVKAAHSKSDSQLKDKAIVQYLIAKLKAIEEAAKPKEAEVPLGVIKKTRAKKTTIGTGLIIGF